MGLLSNKFGTAFVLLITLWYGRAQCNSNLFPMASKDKQRQEIFYRELGCKSVVDTTLTRFDCPDFNQTLRKDECVFHNWPWPVGAKLYREPDFDKEFLDPLSKTCKHHCQCKRSEGNESFGKLVCKDLHCPGICQVGQTDTCVKMYSLESCCPIREVCDEDLESLQMCEIESKLIYEGQKMKPRDSCYTCYCSVFWSRERIQQYENMGRTAGTQVACVLERCMIKEFYAKEIHDGCAPVYKEDECCPHKFHCRGQNDTLVSEGRKEEGLCKFGDLQVGVGGSVQAGNRNITCHCAAPPFLECFRRNF